jgi:type II secretory pathway component PulK
MHVTRRSRRPGDAERGVALIFVLAGLSLLLLVGGEFALQMRLEGSTTLNFRNAVTETFLAQAAYQRAVVEILPNALVHHLDATGQLVFRRTRLESPSAPERLDLALGPGRMSYRITDEDSRIHLNRATPEVLHRLLMELGVEREARDVIIDSILDWRDQNEDHRLNGAESDYYRALPAPYRSKNANFDSVDELLQVRGVTPAIFYGRPESPGLAEYVTVAGSGAINANTASPTVLRALGFAQAEVELIIAGRPYLDRVQLRTRFPQGSLRVQSAAFRVEAWGEMPGQGRRTLTAIVQRRRNDEGLVQVMPLTWRWAESQEEGPGAGNAPPDAEIKEDRVGLATR